MARHAGLEGLLVVGLLGVLAAPSAAQTWMFNVLDDGALFGRSLARAGDMDGDGLMDIIVGNRGGPGRAAVFSSADGSLIRDWFGSHPTDGLGRVVAGIGDIDGDGVGDLLATSPGWGGADWTGRAFVFSGGDGSTLREHTWFSQYEEFGFHGGAVGDVNGDGVGDYAIGTFQYFTGLTSPYNGDSYVFSGLSSTPISGYLSGGRDAVPAGDVNGDGQGDYLWHGWADSYLQYPRAVLATSGAILDSVQLDEGGRVLVAPASDFDGDGLDEYVFGMRGPGGGQQVLQVRRTGGHVLLELAFPSPGAWAVDARGDVNGDAVPDLLVGFPWDSTADARAGAVRAYSGVDGHLLYELFGERPNEFFGRLLVTLGDLDGDGCVDFAASAAGNDDCSTSPCSPTGFKMIRLYSGALDPWTDLGQSLIGSAGTPQLVGFGQMQPGQLVTLAAHSLAEFAPATMVVGLSHLDAPYAGGVLGPAPDVLVPLTTTAGGTLRLAAPWPGDVPSDVDLYVQAWIEDAGGLEGWSATNTLMATTP